MRWIVLAVTAATLLGFVAAPQPHSSDATPLVWDMAHHTLRSEALAAAIRSGQPTAVLAELRTWDVYPPFLYLVAGSIVAAMPNANFAWQLLPLLLWGSILAAFRCGVGRSRPALAWIGLLLIASNAKLLSLSQQRMLDLPAAVVALLALALLVRLRGSPSRRSAVLAFLALSAALLSKHNVGLPLLPVGLALALERWLRRDRRASHWILAVAVAGTLVWVGFLSWQDHGWESFLSFAANRANSEQMAPMQRVLWYVTTWARAGFGFASVAWFGLLLIAWSWRRPGAFALSAQLYALLSLVALARHPYLLDRNFTSSALVLCVPMSAAIWDLISRWQWRRPVRWILSLATAAILLISAGRRARVDYRTTVPERLALLAPVSQRLGHWFADAPSAIVQGSFNELSHPWLSLLWARAGGDPEQLSGELYYPLDRERSGLDARPDPAYSEVFARWVRGELPQSAITIELRSDSPFFGGDYVAWNEWKQNYFRLIEESPQFLLRERSDFPNVGLTVSRYASRFLSVEWKSGFAKPENWGRWMRDPIAIWQIPARADAGTLCVEFAPHHEQRRPIRLALYDGDDRLSEWDIAGTPWRFQARRIPLAPSPLPRSLRLELLDDGRAGDAASSHCVAFGNVGVLDAKP